MFINSRPKEQIEKYVSLLQRIGALSRLFSESSTPYLYYRAAENAFCKAFEAYNHSRSDTQADASIDTLGIGLKTYIEGKGNSYQKISEFNRDRGQFSSYEKQPEKIIEIVSLLRNKRIELTKSVHGLENLVYHCVTRQEGQFNIYEESMNEIQLDAITYQGAKGNSIYFSDGLEEYQFNKAKSTLFKRFKTKKVYDFPVRILKEPFDFLDNANSVLEFEEKNQFEAVYLPLYSTKGEVKYVPEKSGINQWNAGGRPRGDKEVYIRVPAWIHKEYAEFFPPRDVPFNLKLPNGEVISAKICQDGGKALMSNPNSALGNWLIDTVFKADKGEPISYKYLEDIGIDSVEIRKINQKDYEIDFKSIGTFERFEDALKG